MKKVLKTFILLGLCFSILLGVMTISNAIYANAESKLAGHASACGSSVADEGLNSDVTCKDNAFCDKVLGFFKKVFYAEVSFDTDGGTEIESQYVFRFLGKISVPANPEKEGYTFDGWDKEIPQRTWLDINFKAKWSGIPYSVTLNDNGATTPFTALTSYTCGEGATLPTDGAKTGYTFAGWYDNAELEGNAITEITKTDIDNKEYWAKWTANSYSVTLNDNNATTPFTVLATYTYGVGATLPADGAKTGYTFAGWYDNAELEGSAVATISKTDLGNKEYWAKWSLLVTGITLDKAEATLGKPVTLTATVMPENATDKTVTWSSSDESVASVDENGVVTGLSGGTATITATANDGSGVTATTPCTVTVETVQLWEDGPYWAICNVGAEKPEEYGYHYLWGSTKAYIYDSTNSQWVSVDDGSAFEFSWKNCATYNKNDETLLSEGFIDSTGNLVAQYDVATANLGESWRMPTGDEFSALIENCTTEPTTDYNGTGVAGELITGKGEYASRSIFLPAAGWGDRGDRYYYPGERGFYLSSTPSLKLWYITGRTDPYTNYSAYGVWFDCEQNFKKTELDRYNGRSVRPVYVFAE